MVREIKKLSSCAGLIDGHTDFIALREFIHVIHNERKNQRERKKEDNKTT